MAKFNVGDVVYYRAESAPSRDASKGTYEVVRVMPIEKDNIQNYRIKNTVEGFERVATESELRSAA